MQIALHCHRGHHSKRFALLDYLKAYSLSLQADDSTHRPSHPFLAGIACASKSSSSLIALPYISLRRLVLGYSPYRDSQNARRAKVRDTQASSPILLPSSSLQSRERNGQWCLLTWTKDTALFHFQSKKEGPDKSYCRRASLQELICHPNEAFVEQDMNGANQGTWGFWPGSKR